MTDRARILVFTGDGKGKTTAALGMALRASGHGLRTLILQFIKNDTTTGEVAAVAAMDMVDLQQHGCGFVPRFECPELADHRRAAQMGLAQAAQAIDSDRYDLIVLDEICGAITTGLLAEADVLSLIRSAKPGTRLVLTGRNATDAIMATADTVTNMQCVKHGLAEGIAAQTGVER